MVVYSVHESCIAEDADRRLLGNRECNDTTTRLIEETKNFPTGMLSSCLLMVHNTIRRSKHDIAELTRRQQIGDPLFDFTNANVKARGDHAALVDTTDEIDDDFAGAMIIHKLKFADVAVRLHHLKKLDDDFGGGAKEGLALAALLGVGEGLEGIAQNGHTHFEMGEPKDERRCW